MEEKRKARTRSGGHVSGAASQKESGLIGEMSRLLRGLAHPLLRAGITPKQFADIAAGAFVQAACSASTMRNGRVNQSRVAVLTGLSRVEVRKFLTNKSVQTPAKLARTSRVIDGWTSDRRYLAPDGRPQRLRIQGHGNTFVSLVKNFAGDVPHRALLDELRRMKAVRELDACVELLDTSNQKGSRLARQLGAVLPLIADGVAIATEESTGHTPIGLFRLTLSASDARALAMIQERADSSARAWLGGLRESLSEIGLADRRKGRAERRVTVSVLVRKQDLTRNTKR